jgi:hypothetical protein
MNEQRMPAATLAPRAGLTGEAQTYGSGRWVVVVVVAQVVCQLLLLVPEFAAVRVLIRFMAFGISLAMVAAFAGRNSGRPTPLVRLAVAIIIILALACFNTEGTLLAGIATLALNLAIIGPVFWVPSLRVSRDDLRLAFLALVCFHGLSSMVAILQVYYPGQFQWTVSSVIANDQYYLDELTITNARGETVYRPSGLTDIPGGAAGSGFLASLFGACLIFTERRVLTRVFLAGCIFAGLFSLYVSQVRILVVMTAVGYLTFLLVLFYKRCIGHFAVQLSVGVVLGVISFQFALDMAGLAVTERLSTLVEESPVDVYYSNRGVFLEKTFTVLLPEYPLGAGPGRWGMMCYYFGDRQTSIWAEIQWTGWLLDGGVPLMAAYVVALVTAFWLTFRVIRRLAPGPLLFCAALVTAYGIGAVASTFGSCSFSTTFGLTFWLLFAAVLQAAKLEGVSIAPRQQPRRAAQPVASLRGGRRRQPDAGPCTSQS